MDTPDTPSAGESQQTLRESLLKIHGPLLGGLPLAMALGHRTAGSFRQARARRQVPVRIFRVPGRRGWFALTFEVADCLFAMRQKAGGTPGEEGSN